MNNISCPICGNEDQSMFSGYIKVSPHEEINMITCEKCHKEVQVNEPRKIVDNLEAHKEFDELMTAQMRSIWPEMNNDTEVILLTGTYEELGVTKTLCKD